MEEVFTYITVAAVAVAIIFFLVQVIDIVIMVIKDDSEW